MRILSDIKNREVYKLGIAYITFITIIAAISNYFIWHAKLSSILIEVIVFIFGILLWIALYAPMYIFIKRDAWRISDFGFVVNKSLIIASAVLTLFLIIKFRSSFSLAFFWVILLEAFARVGEEVFYRGFIYTFTMKLLNGKQNAWVCAVFISSFTFAIVHTQTFLPGNSLNIPSIFVSALILGLLRFWTGSILLGIIIHSISNGGILCMIIGILIYATILIIIGLREKPNRIQTNTISANKVD